MKVKDSDGKAHYKGQTQLDGTTLHGKGVWTRYIGEFRDGKLSTSYKEVVRYEGEFCDGQRSGRGTLITPEGKRLECGAWDGHYPRGACVQTDPDGVRHPAWYDGKKTTWDGWWAARRLVRAPRPGGPGAVLRAASRGRCVGAPRVVAASA